MKRIYLYIDGRKADLDEAGLVLFTYTREDLDNPAAIRNAYTRQITLPGTPANEIIFGTFSRADRRTAAGGGAVLKFSATNRTPFRICDDKGAVLESGYMKLESIAETRHGVHSYTVTLFGGLGGFLYGLMYVDDGTPRSLSSLWYLSPDDNRAPADEFTVNANAATVRRFWNRCKAHERNGWKETIDPATTTDGAYIDPAGDTETTSGPYYVNEYEVSGGDTVLLSGYNIGPDGALFSVTDADGDALLVYPYRGVAGSFRDYSLTIPARGVRLRVTGSRRYGQAQALAKVAPEVADVVGFIPAYNGTPASPFDAQRAVQKPGALWGIPDVGGYYAPGTGGTCIVSYSQKYTEWQVRDLRAYLQRPVVRIRAIIDAIAQPYNNGGYTVNLDPAFFSTENYYYNETWMTLPLLDIDKVRPSGSDVTQRVATKGDFLGTAFTPADVLLSFVKTFGLVVTVDESIKTVDIRTRSAFYQGPAVDLDNRVDLTKDIKTTPLSFSRRFLDFKAPQYGEFAEDYAAKYGRTFGAFRVDTGYSFDDTAEDIMASSVFRGAPEAREVSKYFCAITPSGSAGAVPSPLLDGNAKYALRLNGGTETKTFDVPPVQEGDTVEYFDADAPLADLVPKIQLHGTDQAAQTGEGVLVFYRGAVNIPRYLWGLTDDHPAMAELNNDAPCWFPNSFRANGYEGTELTELPVFGRYRLVEAGVAFGGLDFGVPAEVPMPDTEPAEGSGLYSRYWRRYIEDRCDVDARVVRLRCNLAGLPAPSELLRRFAYWRGSVWAFNRIEDVSLTTEYFPIVELVKVKDITNYRNYGD